jgi:hypothetical protein
MMHPMSPRQGLGRLLDADPSPAPEPASGDATSPRLKKRQKTQKSAGCSAVGGPRSGSLAAMVWAPLVRSL